MRALLDTHAFLWFITGDRRMSSQSRSVIEDPGNDLLLSMASVWEMEGISILSSDEAFDVYGVTRLW